MWEGEEFYNKQYMFSVSIDYQGRPLDNKVHGALSQVRCTTTFADYSVPTSLVG